MRDVMIRVESKDGEVDETIPYKVWKAAKKKVGVEEAGKPNANYFWVLVKPGEEQIVLNILNKHGHKATKPN